MYIARMLDLIQIFDVIAYLWFAIDFQKTKRLSWSFSICSNFILDFYCTMCM